jgi:Transposase DDE domain
LASHVLLLFDRGYFSFPWLDEMTKRGLTWVSRYANKVSYTVIHTCYIGDGVSDEVVLLGNYRADQARYPVRLISFWHKGRHDRYLTNVLDPHMLSVAQIAKLYARRWDIEIGFRMLKDYLGIKTIWSAKWPVIRVQIWTCLLLAQLFHALQRQVAVQAEVAPEEVSLDVLVRLMPKSLPQGEGIVSFVARCGREIGVIRPSTRIKIEAPWIDPSWVTSPPPEAMRPRDKVRYGHRNGERGRSRSRSQARSQARSPN